MTGEVGFASRVMTCFGKVLSPYLAQSDLTRAVIIPFRDVISFFGTNVNVYKIKKNLHTHVGQYRAATERSESALYSHQDKSIVGCVNKTIVHVGRN